MSSKVRLAQYDGHVFIVFAAMTPRQVQIVQNTFRLLAPHAAEATEIFYNELFRIAPDTRELFPGDLTHQKGKFVQMLGTVVRCLDDVSAISEHIADLGRRHASYDVREGDYKVVGQALLSMLHRSLGARCTPEIRDAWAAAYEMIAWVMKEAAAEPHPAGMFFSRVVRGVMTSQYGVACGLDADEEERAAAAQTERPLRRARSP
jgi:hemoglobin-like flavoprotein